ncbi:MAG: HAMP domain-containing histidine kinase [Akkermansiaceae bacterium]|nr:HAMP domain-containing histidine kinase [Armatimonadota bacterium]
MSVNNEPNASADTAPIVGEDVQSLLRQRDRQIEAIRRVSETLFTHPGTDPMVRETLRIALDVLRADAGTVYLHDPKDDTLVFRYVIGGSGEQLLGTRVPSDKGIAGTVFRSGMPRLDNDVQVGGDYNAEVETRFGYHTKSMMTAPIKRTNAAPVGVMQILNANVAPFGERDLAVLEVLCAQAATGIEHFQLVEAARRTEIVHVIGDVSHDIKNMLTPITTGVQTLEPMLDNLFAQLQALREQCNEPAVEGIAVRIGEIAAAVQQDYGWMLQNSLFAAEQIQARTREIADAIKGETAPPYFEMASLNETCEQVLQTLKAVAAKRGVAFVTDLDPALPPVEFDRKQIYNALYNLVNNALPETPEGGSVTIHTRPNPSGETITIQIIDTGRGIPEHVRERLFTDAAISTKPGGTGLGTRIVMGVVQRHNGTITVESEIGSGSTFTITVPVRHA